MHGMPRFGNRLNLFVAVAAAALMVAGAPAFGQPDIAISVALELLPGADVTAPSGEGAAPGDTLYYLFWVQNTGDLATSYKLTVTTESKWSAVLPQHSSKQIPTLQPGQIEIVPVAVIVPTSATVGSTGATTLTAAATEKPRPSDQDTVVTTVIPNPEIPKTVITPPGQSGAPGTTVVYNFQVKNIGVTAATYQLRVSSSPKWTTSLPNHPKGRIDSLAPEQVETVPVAVQIPSKAGIGDTCDTTLTAIRLGRPKISDEGIVTTVVVAPSSLGLAISDPAPGDGVWVYFATLTNNSGQARQVLIAGVSLRGRHVTMDGQPDAIVTVPAGGAAEVELTVTADSAGSDYLIVSAEDAAAGTLRVQAAKAIPRG